MLSAPHASRLPLTVPEGLSFEPFHIRHPFDQKLRDELDFQPDFPLQIDLYSFEERNLEFPLTWHERLELLLPLRGEGVFVMGDRSVPFSAGDLLIVDNLKLHGLAQFRGSQRRTMVITFLSDFVYHPGSPPCDYALLSPFHCQDQGCLPVLRATDSRATAVHLAIEQLLDCYAKARLGIRYQTSCKVYLLQVLLHLVDHCGWPAGQYAPLLSRRERARQFGEVFALLNQRYHERLTVAQAANMVGLSDTRFMRCFKKITGYTFISYLAEIRLAKALSLLRETDESIAEIAASVGFCDQSYFDKLFRRRYQLTPRQVRTSLGSSRAGGVDTSIKLRPLPANPRLAFVPKGGEGVAQA